MTANREWSDERDAWRSIGASPEDAARLATYSTNGLGPDDPGADYERCRRCGKYEDTTEDRYSLGLYAGRMCDACWKASGYRDEGREGFDPLDAGESYEEET